MPTLPVFKLVRSEAAEQRDVARWLDLRRVLWCHVPNGGKRSAPTAAAMRAAGVKPGIPDILVFTPPPKAPDAVGAALEMKRTGGAGRTSAEQQAWLVALTEVGWAVYVAEGSDAAIAWLTELGY